MPSPVLSIRQSRQPSEANIQWCWVPLSKSQNIEASFHPLEKIWVRLTTESDTEVLLLCPASDTQWVIWNPDYGEQTISINQFCLIPPN